MTVVIRWDKSRCHQERPDPEMFFDDDRIPEAVAFCSLCDIRPECLQFAINMKEREGVWGGESRAVLGRIQIKRKRAKCPGCASLTVKPGLAPNTQVCGSCGLSWLSGAK